MLNQLTDTILMIQPTQFGFNEEAFETNSFQNKPARIEEQKIQGKALKEFFAFVEKLKGIGVQVIVFKDFENSTTPDSIFPNNWFSTHQSNYLITYPMAVSNRRKERREDIIDYLISKNGFEHQPLESFEESCSFLEGTGSLIFDHENKIVYAARSPRTHLNVIEELCKLLGYKSCIFESYGKSGELIYHTNVMMCIGESFIAIGKDTIQESDRFKVHDSIEKSGKELIYLSNDQVYNHFAGNMLQIKNIKGERVLVMSDTAFDSLSSDQKNQFERHTDHIVQAHIPTIERVGGGSARCMIAEVF